VAFQTRGDVEKLIGLANCLLHNQRGREKRGASYRRGRRRRRFLEIGLRRGRRVVAEAGAGKEVPGAILL
jgi:hypothetical protein